MDLDLTAEQQLLRESVRRVCERHGGLDVVRKMENDPVGYPPLLWSALAELGVVGMSIPTEHGGSGMSLLDAAVVYLELGRALAPVPHLVSSVLAGGLLREAGSAAQRGAWLPRVAAGDAVLSVGWLEPDRGFGPAGVALAAEPAGDGWVLTGAKRHVAYAQAATRLLTLARTDAGVTLFLVDPQAPGLTLTQQATLAGDTQYRADFAAVRVGADDLVGQPGTGWPAWERVRDDALVLLAAQAVGGARRALELAVDYAKVRHQFGKPLGAFQALAHELADAVTAVDGAETLVWEAAWAGGQDRVDPRLAPMAKLYAAQTFRDVTATAQQVFGGVGFTVEFDVQLYFRRAKSLQVGWWDAGHLEELVATAVLGTDRS